MDNKRVDFFVPACQTDNITACTFGLCDPQDGGKAFVDVKSTTEWIATVENRACSSLNFTAIDNCVDIWREDGKMDFRCDGMLTGGGYLIFIELKDQASNWISHAVNEQLQTTIDHFKKTYDISRFPKRYAYACNRRHPQFQFSHMELMNNFRRRNNIRLCIVNTIVIK